MAPPRLWLLRTSNIDHHYFLRVTVQPLGRTVAGDKKVVTYPRIKAAAELITRMTGDVHVGRDRRRLIKTDEWSLHQVIALSVTVEPRLTRPTIVHHEGVVLVPDVTTRDTFFQQAHAILLGPYGERALLEHYVGNGSERCHPSELGVLAPWSIALDQETDHVAFLDDLRLVVRRTKRTAASGLPGGTQVQALLAAHGACRELGYRRQLTLAHSRSKRGERRLPRRVLNGAGAPDELQLFGRLHHLHFIDDVPTLHELGVGHFSADVLNRRVGHLGARR